ncbi:hypothetical protein [Leptospira interrogans]|uniref:hypothetical protein n=1 Tax=Leptospira interrogans TaxID=173 RepID=UPI000A577071|nr:hypothetical protein [Leptospira interrogans]
MRVLVGLRLYIIILALGLTGLNAKDDQYPEFQSALESVSVKFKNKSSYKPVSRIKQEDVTYQYAFRKEGYDGEVRISLFPNSITYSDEKQNEYLFRTSTEVVMLNISQPKDGELVGGFSMFPPEGVKPEYGADYGMSGLIEGNSDFSKGYKYVQVIGLWKKGVDFAYIFILFNDIQKSIPFPMDLFYCIAFRD